VLNSFTAILVRAGMKNSNLVAFSCRNQYKKNKKEKQKQTQPQQKPSPPWQAFDSVQTQQG
jgi:hypothetical protein